MASGDLTLYDDFAVEINSIHDLAANAFMVKLITNAVPPLATHATNTAYTEVSGANYTAGGIAVDGTWTDTGTGAKFDFVEANVSWAQDASGFTNASYAIIYNSTPVADNAVAFIDLAGPLSSVTGSITITFGAGGIFTLT